MRADQGTQQAAPPAASRVRLLAGLTGGLQLRTLDLSGNKLAALPAEIAGLTALKKLSVSGNRLERLPNLAALQALQAVSAAPTRHAATAL